MKKSNTKKPQQKKKLREINKKTRMNGRKKYRSVSNGKWRTFTGNWWKTKEDSLKRATIIMPQRTTVAIFHCPCSLYPFSNAGFSKHYSLVNASNLRWKFFIQTELYGHFRWKIRKGCVQPNQSYISRWASNVVSPAELKD